MADLFKNLGKAAPNLSLEAFERAVDALYNDPIVWPSTYMRYLEWWQIWGLFWLGVAEGVAILEQCAGEA